jgi:hypothetical protein
MGGGGGTAPSWTHIHTGDPTVLWATDCTANTFIRIYTSALGPINKQSVLSTPVHKARALCNGAACTRSCCSWGTFSGRTVTTTARFTMSSTVVRISVNQIISPAQLPSCPLLGPYSAESAEHDPTQSRRKACLTRCSSSGRSKTTYDYAAQMYTELSRLLEEPYLATSRQGVYLYIFLPSTCFGPCWPSSGGIHNTK